MLKKIIFVFMCIASIVLSGCGDRFAKEKEEILKIEKVAMSMDVPILENPFVNYHPSGYSPEFNKKLDEYYKGMKKLKEVETKVLEKMRESDTKITEMERKADDSEKKDLKAFKDKVRAARIEFVKKISKRRLNADPVIVGIGSTWQEVEMVYGKPNPKSSDNDWYYDGLYLWSFVGRGAPKDAHKFKSDGPMVLELSGDKFKANSGIKIGMPREEVRRILKEKFVPKDEYTTKKGFMLSEGSDSRGEIDHITWYAMEDTAPELITLCIYKDGKLVKYGQYPN